MEQKIKENFEKTKTSWVVTIVMVLIASFIVGITVYYLLNSSCDQKSNIISGQINQLNHQLIEESNSKLTLEDQVKDLNDQILVLQTNKEDNKIISEEEISIEPSNIDVILEWKTYDYKKLSFTFDYPRIASLTINPWPLNRNSLPEIKYSGNRIYTTPKEEYVNQEYENYYEELEKLMDNYGEYENRYENCGGGVGGPCHRNYKKLRIDNIPALNVCYNSSGGGDNIVIFLKDGLIYTLSANHTKCNILPHEKKDNFYIVFERLLETFKFKK